ncbi:IclR family transcriptional regulator [Paraburkholderia sp. J63]|uniref:IclR family transcriptional regulator n=1 Tax=Paraburkholderia sp. J63 TaxID=2805434 RepID=UPI0039F4C0E2
MDRQGGSQVGYGKETRAAAEPKRDWRPGTKAQPEDDETIAAAKPDLGAGEGGEAEGAGPSCLVPGLDRGLRILAEFSAREPVLGAPELSKRIGIPRTTTFRLLQTLEALGFLERVNGDRHFRLGVAVLRLGFEYLSSLELTDFGTPILERLRDVTGLSTHLLIRDERDVVFVARAQTLDPMFSSVKVHVGSRLPAHATVHGQVLLGDFTEDALSKLYPEPVLQRYTDHTPMTVDDLYVRIRAAAAQGYALSEGSFEAGVSVVSAPVRDHTGKIVAVVSAAAPHSQLGARSAPLITSVCAAAVELSSCLNHRPTLDDPTVARACENTNAQG